MCKFVGIVVYQGLIEDVAVFEKKTKAIEWMAGKMNEYGKEETVDSLIWDVQKQSRIDLGVAVSR